MKKKYLQVVVGLAFLRQCTIKTSGFGYQRIDLRTDMFEIAADQFRGREAGTLDELKVSMWLANKARDSGMKPAGDNGTFSVL